ncbi:15033_t:CDS:2 [Entrophospora sp. SA101]|nr:15033_t:CDS:2 [Entrophospora sp. SA101]
MLSSLPYKLVSDVDWDKYVECTDKNNVHDIWEWNNRRSDHRTKHQENMIGVINIIIHI